MKTWVIGDIHGGLKALKQVLERANVEQEDRLIFLGDYVDGWSDSAAVISFLIELGKDRNCIFIRGNHDDLTHEWLVTQKHNPLWVEHGGRATLEAYRGFSKKEIQEHIKFFEDLRNYYVDNENRLYVHAGFTNMHGPEREYNKETFYWDRTLWETAVATYEHLPVDSPFFPKRFGHFKEIFIGHTPTVHLGTTEPINALNVWNVDTGSAFKGVLTIMDVDTKKFFQSDPVYQLYPDERGRN